MTKIPDAVRLAAAYLCSQSAGVVFDCYQCPMKGSAYPQCKEPSQASAWRILRAYRARPRKGAK